MDPGTLRYNARANIAADEEFKRGVSSIRKKAERQIVTSPKKNRETLCKT